MTRKVTVERLSYLSALLPLAASLALHGSVPLSGAAIGATAVMSGVMIALVLLARHNRRLTERNDALLKTMNEAIIHDLKNPMTSIMACLWMLEGDEADEARRKRVVSIALHSCRAQMTLLDTLVDTARLEEGAMTLRRRSLDIHELLRECLDGVRGTADSLGIRLDERYSKELPDRIAVDPDLFPRVILNLLNNALKYTPSGGAVTLEADVRGNEFHFSVHDTGVGIGKTHIAQLFKKYYRVEGGDQTSRRGTGLGLYFCRLVVEAHGGTIRIVSDNGNGTEVSIALPNAANRSFYYDAK